MSLSQFTIHMLSTKYFLNNPLHTVLRPQMINGRHCGYKRTVILIPTVSPLLLATVSPLLLVTKLGIAHVGAQASKKKRLVGVRPRYS